MAVTGPRRVTVMGATGSVGRQTLDVIAQSGGRFVVEALVGGRDVDKLARAARASGARLAVVADPQGYAALGAALAGTGIEVAAGPEAVLDAAGRPAEIVVAAIVGAAGLASTLAAIRRGATVALANKETLVCAGSLVTAACAAHGGRLIPVDSEHSAIFQVFDRSQSDQVEKLILTASGGPFRTRSLADMARATPAEAVAHPNWSMGAKISVDSATMMNKGLEMIEAFHLFPVREDQIEVVVHPQSIVHSMVAYADGSVLAQLGTPDMRTPIAVALSWPQRMPLEGPRLDLRSNLSLTFEPADLERFPSLKLARDVLRAGGALPTVLNAANEVAVAAFLASRIGFLDIARVVEQTLARSTARAPSSIAEVEAIDAEARRGAEASLPTSGRAA
ncbi:MAG: 1-deoxy-D-xylulose-5-phosphate reductoisomerase [Alphaproteobacteria bacterium]|nr:1-deoxy-D-xylulose-5-phosphate reductoisomerase [Alphaproteobacteria bacterium]